MKCDQYSPNEFGCVRCFGVAAQAVAVANGFTHALVLARKGDSTKFAPVFPDYLQEFEARYLKADHPKLQEVCSVVTNNNQIRRFSPWVSVSSNGRECCKTVTVAKYVTFAAKSFVLLLGCENEGTHAEASARLRQQTNSFRVSEMLRQLKSVEGWIYR